MGAGPGPGRAGTTPARAPGTAPPAARPGAHDTLHTHTHTHTHTHLRARARARTRTHARARARTRAHAHARTHARTPGRALGRLQGPRTHAHGQGLGVPCWQTQADEGPPPPLCQCSKATGRAAGAPPVGLGSVGLGGVQGPRAGGRAGRPGGSSPRPAPSPRRALCQCAQSGPSRCAGSLPLLGCRYRAFRRRGPAFGPAGAGRPSVAPDPCLY